MLRGWPFAGRRLTVVREARRIFRARSLWESWCSLTPMRAPLPAASTLSGTPRSTSRCNSPVGVVTATIGRCAPASNVSGNVASRFNARDAVSARAGPIGVSAAKIDQISEAAAPQGGIARRKVKFLIHSVDEIIGACLVIGGIVGPDIQQVALRAWPDLNDGHNVMRVLIVWRGAGGPCV